MKALVVVRFWTMTAAVKLKYTPGYLSDPTVEWEQIVAPQPIPLQQPVQIVQNNPPPEQPIPLQQPIQNVQQTEGQGDGVDDTITSTISVTYFKSSFFQIWY